MPGWQRGRRHGTGAGARLPRPGLLGLGFRTLPVRPAGCWRCSREGPGCERGWGAIRLSLKVGFNSL